MKIIKSITSLIAISGVASAEAKNSTAGVRQQLDLNLGDSCNKLKSRISGILDTTVKSRVQESKGKYPDACVTPDNVRGNVVGELHQSDSLNECYFESKAEALNSGKIRFFTSPKKTERYNPKTDHPLLKAILASNKAPDGEKFALKRIGKDFAAVSASASADTKRVFSSFKPSDMDFKRPETVASAMAFLFLAGEDEVPSFDRALYALSVETYFSQHLRDANFDAPFKIPTEIVKAAIDNDADLSSEHKEVLLPKLNDLGDELNIGKGADSMGIAVRKAIGSITDKCPSKTGDFMKFLSLTETSLYFPMIWDNSALKSASASGQQVNSEL